MAIQVIPPPLPWRDAPLVIRPKLGHRLSSGQVSMLVHQVLFTWSGFVVVPSDTGFAFVTIPTDPRAIGVLATLLRHQHDPIPLCVSSLREAEDWIEMHEFHYRVLEQLWPGPLTVVGRAKGLFARRVAKNVFSREGTLGLRMTDGFEQDLVVAAGLPLTTAAVRYDDGRIVRSYEDAISIIWQRLVSAPEIRVPWAAIKTDRPFPSGSHSTVLGIDPSGSIRRIRAGAVAYEDVVALMQRVSATETDGWT